MSSEQSEEDIYAVEKLHCTICQHDLNHSIYQICRHPLLDVPLCVICHQNLLESDFFGEFTDASEICVWCGDGGDLFLCDDEEKCKRAFCRDCITNNLGEEAAQSIEEDDHWLCLCCSENSTMTAFAQALEAGEDNSVYHRSSEPAVTASEASSVDHEGATEEEREIAKQLFILQALVRESNAASECLEEGALRDRLAEISDELRTIREGRYGTVFSLLSFDHLWR